MSIRDDYRDNIRNYLELTGQIDGENRKLSSNTEASGRYHTDWLNMMYPRLKIARNTYLVDDGKIIVGIGQRHRSTGESTADTANEVFGEEQFQAQVVRVEE